MNLLVTGGAGFIGSAYVRLARRRRPDDLVVNVDALTYAGNLENLRDLEGDARHVFVRADIRDGDAMLESDAASRRSTPSSTSPPRATSTAASCRRQPFLDTNVGGDAAPARGRARGRRPAVPADSTDEVYGTLGADRAPSRRRRRSAPAQSVLGEQGRRGPLRDGVPPHARDGHRDHALLEQLRPVPVPREADPAHDPERLRRPAAAGLRRWPSGARLDPRRRPLRGGGRRPRARAAPARSTTSAPRTSGRTWTSSARSCGSPARDESLIRHVPDRPGTIDATR